MNFEFYEIENIPKGDDGELIIKRIVQKKMPRSIRDRCFRYVGQSTKCDEKLHWSEHAFLMAIMFVLCLLCIRELYEIMTIETEEYSVPISEIPFPTVTLCDPIIVNPKLLNYSDIFKRSHTGNLTKNEFQSTYPVEEFCRGGELIASYRHIFYGEIEDRNIWPRLQNISPNMWQDSHCSLNDKFFDCEGSIFTKVLWNFGVCYTFNNLGSETIYYQEILADDVPKFNKFFIHDNTTNYNNVSYLSYPYKVRNEREGIRISMKFGPERDYDPHCNSLDQTNHIQLFVHTAGDQFLTENEKLLIPLDHQVQISVRPQWISIDKIFTKIMTKDERGCVYDNENILQFFRTYSKSKCYQELKVKALYDFCNCAFFWMPRRNDTRICEPGERCVIEFRKSENIDYRRCLPSCNETTYEAKIIKQERRLDDTRYLDVLITFDDEKYSFTNHYAFFNFLKFLADAAGTLGLFMGISILRVAKMLYCATIRPFVYKRKLPPDEEINKGTLIIALTRRRKGDKPHHCNVCKKSFTRKEHLSSHLRLHTRDKPYRCNLCNKSYTRKDHLLRHSRTHSGEKPYRCNDCNKTFMWKSDLSIHSRIHTGERPYSCNDCNKTFTRKADLSIHSRIHTGETHRCNECNKSFTRKSSLSVHLRIHTGDKPHHCSFCKKSFTRKDHLSSHLRIHTRR